MIDRYRRQSSFHGVGKDGQQRIENGIVAICGVGALGSAVAERLCRAGVKKLICIDRDWVELDNLPRQTLYDEKDAEEAKPKAVAIYDHLRRINSNCEIVPMVRDLSASSISELLSGAHCIVDGTDNFETRYLLNDYAIDQKVPWVHAGIVGASGQSMTILPGRTACFRCLLPDPPPAEEMQSCDSAGVLGPAVGVIANWQALEVLKLLVLCDRFDNVSPERLEEMGLDGALRVFDLWKGHLRAVQVPRQVGEGKRGCIACRDRSFEFLRGERGTTGRQLCGRNAVQINPGGKTKLNLTAIANRLQSECEIKLTRYMIRFNLDGIQWSLFEDGRAVLTGTEDISFAKSLYSRWIGN